MKTTIKNWLENHETIYGIGLLFVSICTVAFGGAYLGASAAMNNTTINVNVMPANGSTSEETK